VVIPINQLLPLLPLRHSILEDLKQTTRASQPEALSLVKLKHLRMQSLVLPLKETRNLLVRDQCLVEQANQLLRSILVVRQVLNQMKSRFHLEAANHNPKLKKNRSVLEALLLKTLVEHLLCSHPNNRQSRPVPLHLTSVVLASRNLRLRLICLEETRTLKVLDLISAVTTRAPLLLEEICSETPVAMQRPHHLTILEAEVLRTTLKAQASILAETLASLHRLVICLMLELNLLVIMVVQHLAEKLSVPVEPNVNFFYICFCFRLEKNMLKDCHFSAFSYIFSRSLCRHRNP